MQQGSTRRAKVRHKLCHSASYTADKQCISENLSHSKSPWPSDRCLASEHIKRHGKQA